MIWKMQKKSWMEVTTRKNHQKSGERILQVIVTKRHRCTRKRKN